MSVWIKQQPIRTPKPQQAPTGPNRARTAAQNYDRDIQILLQINSVLSADFDWTELVIAPGTAQSTLCFPHGEYRSPLHFTIAGASSMEEYDNLLLFHQSYCNHQQTTSLDVTSQESSAKASSRD
jgi:hypothetical protein